MLLFASGSLATMGSNVLSAPVHALGTLDTNAGPNLVVSSSRACT